MPSSSFVFEIATTATNASIDYGDGFETIPWRSYLILYVFNAMFDIIFRVATFALVAYLAVAHTIHSGRAKMVKFFGIAAVLILSVVTVVFIAFLGASERVQEPYYYAMSSTSYGEDYGSLETAVSAWYLREYQVEMAFYAIYLVAVLAILVASFLTRNVSSATLILLFAVEIPSLRFHVLTTSISCL
jgi:hypothetical protein